MTASQTAAWTAREDATKATRKAARKAGMKISRTASPVEIAAQAEREGHPAVVEAARAQHDAEMAFVAVRGF